MCNLCSSCAISPEFMVMYVFGRFMYAFILLFRNFAILYDGAGVLSIIGLIGSFSLCVFM